MSFFGLFDYKRELLNVSDEEENYVMEKMCFLWLA
jgi:hypothetical protein